MGRASILSQPKPTKANQSQAKQSHAKPSKAKQSQTKPSKAKFQLRFSTIEFQLVPMFD
jgi:hypothetical protein